jgi:hypothetical protein
LLHISLSANNIRKLLWFFNAHIERNDFNNSRYHGNDECIMYLNILNVITENLQKGKYKKISDLCKEIMQYYDHYEVVRSKRLFTPKQIIYNMCSSIISFVAKVMVHNYTQHDLNLISDWFYNNLLTINVKKN